MHSSVGTLAILEGDYGAAIKHLKRAIELDDTLAVPHSNLAVAYASIGRFDDAEAELMKAVQRGYERSQEIRERIDALREQSKASNEP